VISPPVAIIAISTIVTIYYIRNVVKVQIMKMQRRAELEREEAIDRENEDRRVAEAVEEASEEEPRIEIREIKKTVTETEIIADRETLEAALKDHESKQPAESRKQIGVRSSLGGVPPQNEYAEVNQPMDMADPRKTQEPTGIESFDSTADRNSDVPAGSFRKVLGSVDSDVYTAAKRDPVGYNEGKAPPKLRSYNENEGQYDIDESRPSSEVERYEIADFTPNNDMGNNKFESVGKSIDDKINILNKGVLPSSMPPPDYNKAYPMKSR
jgi:hypothetical protein